MKTKIYPVPSSALPRVKQVSEEMQRVVDKKIALEQRYADEIVQIAKECTAIRESAISDICRAVGIAYDSEGNYALESSYIEFDVAFLVEVTADESDSAKIVTLHELSAPDKKRLN